MNSIKLNGSNELDALRQSQRPDVTREVDELKKDGQIAPEKSVGDSISLSDRAATINKLVDAASQLPDIRADKVAQFQAEINAGTYNPPADKIADAILKSGSEDKQVQ